VLGQPTSPHPAWVVDVSESPDPGGTDKPPPNTGQGVAVTVSGIVDDGDRTKGTGLPMIELTPVRHRRTGN
jgi:hypothetical protein